jgi:predicted transcriptional regulator
MQIKNEYHSGCSYCDTTRKIPHLLKYLIDVWTGSVFVNIIRRTIVRLFIWRSSRSWYGVWDVVVVLLLDLLLAIPVGDVVH